MNSKIVPKNYYEFIRITKNDKDSKELMKIHKNYCGFVRITLGLLRIPKELLEIEVELL